MTLDRNTKKVDLITRRFQERPLGHFIDGDYFIDPTSGFFSNRTPIDNKVIGEISEGNAKTVEKACLAATKASVEWQKVSGKSRRDLLHSIADKIEEKSEDIALIESYDTGQPIRFMTKAAARGAENFRFFADLAGGARDGLALQASDHTNYTTRTPVGPVGVITPWNTPFMLSTWKIAPALAAGCTVVHKPAEWSPLSAMLLCEIAHESGLPNGVLNLVNGAGETTGKFLSEDPNIKAISFVGGTDTGRAIMRQSSDTLKRIHFELGGKNPVIVFEDADLQRALDAVIFMIFSLNGERCTSSSRLLIQRTIQEKFIAQLTERIKTIKMGHPLNPETEIGPLIHKEHLTKVMNFISLAKKEGVEIFEGGNRAKNLEEGNFVNPTIFTGATSEMKISQDEIFGPVLSIISFEDENEAIEIANNSRYGLAAYIWTSNLGRSQRMCRAIEAGMIWVNSENNRHLPSPFGGMKNSGIGRDGGDYSFDFYMETKNICLSLDTHRVPTLGKL
ncbi:MAG: 5-carboxymethyl-2-hydroxymuconate semialdehyde dehydrogenase [Pseudomonadota bacterium]|nr:5-carboxymethyl-2-hydroxymuconate semialdehyde dehydrogenase [Pseudomonadota bacterium]